MTKNFETFYREKYENFIIHEMSLKIDSNQDILNKFPSSIITQGKYYKFSGQKIDEFVDSNNNLYSVYAVGNSRAFLNGQDFALAIVEYKKIDDDSIKMKFINSFHKSKGLMKDIFTNYLLKSYKVIISDDVHTDEGFLFYKQLCFYKKDLGYNFYILNSDKQKKQIEDCSEMNSTFGYDESCGGYRYMIEKI